MDEDDRLFVFLGRGIAQQSTGRRPGARHALLLYARGARIRDAGDSALALAERIGWLDVTILREKEMNADPERIGDETLRAAAATAVQHGSALVVYDGELPPDG